MSGSFVWREHQDTDDASQRQSGSTYIVTAQTTGMALTAATAAAGNSTMIGMFFTGDLPVGTTSIPFASISVFTKSGTVAAGTTVPFKIYAQIPASMSAGPAALKTVNGPGTADLTAAQRTRSTNFTQVNYADGPTTNAEWVINQATLKELLTAAGASSFSGAGTTLDPYVAANGTTSIIHNICFILIGDTLTVGASPSSLNAQITTYEVFTNDTTTAKFATYFQTPSLNISTLDVLDNVVGVDERLHYMILGDSLTWPYAPDLTYDPAVPRPTDSLFTGTNFITGDIITTGVMHWLDGTTDIIPAGATYGGVNRGYTTLQQAGQWYTIIDPDGSVYGHGSIQPEARSGYTKLGCLKDRIISKWGVHASKVVIHSFGWGGSTAARVGGSSGVWNEALKTSDTLTTLDTITDPTTALATITNPLWNKNRDQTGKTAVQVLMDSSIKYMIVMLSLTGNDLFLSWTGASKALTLPISGVPSVVTSAVTAMQANTTTVLSFIKRMRDHYATLPGAISEAHYVGYYNFQAEDPRVPPIVVNLGQPPSSPPMHRGAYVSLANPDDWYGGPNGNATPAGGVAGAMAPYGNAGEAHPAASPGTGSVNAVPMVPMTFFYLLGTTIVGVPAPKTNIVGQPVNCNWTAPRPWNKDDLDIAHQMLMGDRFNATWHRDFNTQYRDWWAHWAADTTYSNSLYSQAATSGGWTAAFGAFQNNITVGSFPWHSAYGTGSGPNIPLNTIAVAIPVTGRNVNNKTVNECIQATCGQSSQNTVAAMVTAGMPALYIDMHDALGSAVGSGGAQTNSADRWAFIDGIHPTFAAAQLASDEYLERALAAGSPLLQKIVAEAHSGMFFAMM